MGGAGAVDSGVCVCVCVLPCLNVCLGEWLYVDFTCCLPLSALFRILECVVMSVYAVSMLIRVAANRSFYAVVKANFFFSVYRFSP